MPKKPLHTKQPIKSSKDFGTMYETNVPLIRRFMFWRTKDQALADDLTSTVFEKAWQSRSSFKGGSVRAWLYRIAHNTLIDHWRKPKEIPVDEDTQLIDHGALDFETVLDQKLMVAKLEVALSKLPIDMRTILELRFIENLSSREVAARLSLSEANVRVMQYRALRKLRGYLE